MTFEPDSLVYLNTQRVGLAGRIVRIDPRRVRSVLVEWGAAQRPQLQALRPVETLPVHFGTRGRKSLLVWHLPSELKMVPPVGTTPRITHNNEDSEYNSFNINDIATSGMTLPARRVALDEAKKGEIR